MRSRALARGVRTVAGMLAVALFASADGPAPSNTAVVPDARAVDSWKKRHDEHVARAKKGKVDVLFLGDSITQRWEDEGRGAWDENFAAWKTANFGIGGDRTQHVLWRITAGGELAGLDPKVVVLLIGTNNVFHNSPAQIASGVQAIVAEVRKQKPKSHVLLLGLLPRLGKPLLADATDAPADHLHARIAEINERLAKLEADEVTFLDFGPKFLDGDGRLLQKWMPDFLHLSPEGYALYATALRAPVEELLSGKPTPKTQAKAAYRRVDAWRKQLMMWVSAAPR